MTDSEFSLSWFFLITLLVTGAVIYYLRARHSDKLDAGRLSISPYSMYIRIFILLLVCISAGSYISYKNFEGHFRTQAEFELASTAALKVDELSSWRRERLGDAEMLHRNLAFAGLVKTLAANPSDVQLQKQIQTWLGNFQVYPEYDEMRLLDLQGQTLVSNPAGLPPLSFPVAMRIPDVLHTRDVTLVDFHRQESDQKIRLCFLIPILDEQNSSQVIALAAISINPERNLYPIFTQWSSRSNSAETLIIRRDGDQALFLNNLRFQNDSALNLSIPLDQTGLISVKAALGQSGVLEGMDYRNHPVIGAVQSVPGSPWVLIASIDVDEIYAPLRERQLQTFLFFGVLTLAAGAGLMLAWRQQQVSFFHRQADTSEALRASQERFKIIFEHAPLGIALIDSLNGKLYEVNPRFAEITGRSMQELRQIDWMEITHPDDVQLDLDNMARLNAGEINGFQMEKRYFRPDGSIVWISMSITPMPVADIHHPRHLCMIEDITRRKQVDEELRSSELNYRTLADTGQALIWTSGTDSLCNYFNKVWIDFTGRTMEQEMGNRWTEGVHPDDFQNCLNTYLTAFDKREAFSMVYRLRRKDGVYRWLQDDGSPRYDLYGNFLGYIGFCLDISERKEAEDLVLEYTNHLEIRVEERTADLSLANLELSRALRARDEFLSSMSHELRTPLTSILGLSESLQTQKYGALNERQLKNLQTIEGSGRHLLDLINDILDLSRIEAGKLDLQMMPCPVTEMCLASLQLTRGMANHKGQTVQYTPCDESLSVLADVRRLKQILVNLLSNAIKFTPEGGELGLEVEADAQAQVIRLRVWDKGIGIKTEDLGRLFKPFIQVDSSLAREYNGTGLGLSLVQRLTKMHNGSIEVESEYGQGSRFTISLPWQPTAQVIPDAAPLSASARARLPLVMIADDNESISQALADFLETKEYRVTQLHSGTELFERIVEFQPDLLLVDNQMPGLCGLETIQRMRSHANPQVASTAVIVVTSLSMPGDRAAALQAGANEYICKPLNSTALAITIQNLLEARL